ncbi:MULTISPECIES: AMP-binding protein, partial [Bacillus]|uniref:AMP-binding protein n=1 Tax=Bacillus TaxID=1386 RepID=UPI00397C6BF2
MNYKRNKNFNNYFNASNQKNNEYGEFIFHFDKDLINKFNSLSKKLNVEYKVLFHTVWFILLSKLLGKDEINVSSIDVSTPVGNNYSSTDINLKCDKVQTFSDLLLNVDCDKQSGVGFTSNSNRHLIFFCREGDYSPQEIEGFLNNELICSVIDLFTVKLTYNVEVYNNFYVSNLLNHLINIIDQLSIDPNIPLREVEIILELEKNNILKKFNGTKVMFSQDETLHFQFEEQVKKSPETKAVVFEENELTYQELNERANQLAYKLREKGV